jgi:hypothetical protein
MTNGQCLDKWIGKKTVCFYFLFTKKLNCSAKKNHFINNKQNTWISWKYCIIFFCTMFVMAIWSIFSFIYILLLWLFALILVILFCPWLIYSFQWRAFLSNVFYLSSICVHTKNKKASKGNRRGVGGVN